MFRVTFLGHQGWLFGTSDTNVLVDPLLTDDFGHGGVVGTVFPPRIFNFQDFPPIDAVLITHEHEDHFDIPSLNRISRSVPVYLSSRSSSAARQILGEMGFNCGGAFPGQELNIRDLRFRLFSPDHVMTDNADEWDVLQFLVRDEANNGSFFSGVDAAITKTTEQILKQLAPSPGIICHTNNSTNWSFMRAGKVLENQPPLDTLGLAVQMAREESLLRFSWGSPAMTLFCGGGFSFTGSRAWMNNNVFFADSERISAALSALIPDARFVVPKPGHTTTMTGGRISDVTEISTFLHTAARDQWPSREFVNDVELAEEYAPACGRTELSDAEADELLHHLRDLAIHLYARKEFRQLYSLVDSESKVDGRRSAIALVLLGDSERNAYTVEWRAQECEFVPVEVEDPFEEYIAGMEMWGTDLLELFRGKFGPSAIVFGRARCWTFLPKELPVQVYGIWELFHPLRRPKEFFRLYNSRYNEVRIKEQAPLVRGR